MIDVNKITSTLAKLPDAQLQQYAQMHKADPYIMSLAMSESNRRKELRAAAQAPSGQEQPKVVDQGIAEMAQAPQQMAQAMPEDQGIAQIPAGNMNFAGGGIIAFADGGDVERYQYGGDTTFDPSGMPVYQQAEQVGEDVPTIRERLGLGNRENRRVLEQAELDAAARRSPSVAPVAPTTRPEIAAEPRVNMGRAPAADVEKPAIERAPAAGGLSGIDALQKKYFGDLEGRSAQAQVMRGRVVQGIKDLAETSLAEVRADQAAEGDLFKGREERLSKREQGLAGLNDKYMGLALFQAGAAMMSTPGGIAAAIGKAVPIGAASYTAGLDKINAAQEKFAEARDRLDDLRANRKDMNRKELRAATRDVNTASLKGQELMLSGLEKDWGIEREAMGKVFTAAADDLKTSKLIGAQERIAGAKAGKEKMEERVFNKLLVENDNDPVRAMSAYNKLMAKSEDLQSLYQKEQLKALAEAKIGAAKMGNAVPGQKEALLAAEREILSGGSAKRATMADVKATAASSGKTEQQVIDAMKRSGFVIQ